MLVLVCAWSLQAAEPKASGLQDNTMERITKKVFESVVKVEARNGFKKVATGVVIDKDGYIVTTGLIWPRNEEITVTTSDGRRSEAKFLGMDPETHLALIQAKEKNITPIVLGKTDGLAPGSWIGVVSVSPENAPQATQGIVSSVTADKLRLNVWVTGGASGSPVVDKDGRMVALLRGIYSENQPVVFEFREREVVGSGYVFNRAEAPSSGMALGIPVEIVKTIAAEIKEKGRVSRGWVGISFAENEDGQVEVVDVEKESPAELAKIEEGDILLSIDGKKITGAPMIVSEIRGRKPGQDVKFEIQRDGKPMDVKVKLGEYPEGEVRRELEMSFPRLFPKPPTPPKGAMPEKIPQTPQSPRPPRPAIERFGTWPGWEKRQYIGVYLQELNKELLDFFGAKEEKGLLVNRITKDGPAEKAGLKVGDVIIRVDGKEVATISGLSELIQGKKKGDKVKIELIRDKKSMSFEVTIAEEEGTSLTRFFGTRPYSEAYGEMSKELLQQYGKSRDIYYNDESRERLKKLTEGMTKKSIDTYQKGKELYEQYLDKDKLRKMTLGKDGIVFRV
ncbi:MAG: PDZ domain-containing protein [Candidatus Aminicenantes bacterium]|nr:PDZ domain-containing protein [Candidatus Aminicenantes bacterium]